MLSNHVTLIDFAQKKVFCSGTKVVASIELGLGL